MRLFPIYAHLEGRQCLVIGGGTIALRKARSLADAGAVVRIVAPDICTEIREEFVEPHEYICREYDPDDLNDVFIVVASTNDEALNARIAADCRNRGILVNAVDQPDDCDFYVPALVQRDDIQIAISTGGKSPAMAGWLRREIDKILSERLGDGLNIISVARRTLIDSNPPDYCGRADGFREFFESELWRDYLDGKRDLNPEKVVEWISSCSD